MIKVVFFGTPKIAEKSLEYLAACDETDVVGVVTQIDRPSGRGHKLTPPPIKVLSEKLNIPVFQPKSIRKELDIQEQLKELNPDFFVTFAFGQILSKEVLEIPKIGTVNLHASLLPQYRGANPIQRCIYNGDKQTGITTMLTVLELDAGDICEQVKIDIPPYMTDIQLAEEISQKSPQLIKSTLLGLYSGKIKPQAQDSSKVTFANKFVKEDGLINFSKNCDEIVNQIRSMNSWPNAYTSFKGKTLKVLSAEKDCFTSNTELGTVVKTDKKGIYVSAKDGNIILKEIKPEGKGLMQASSWVNGAGISVGDKLGV